MLKTISLLLASAGMMAWLSPASAGIYQRGAFYYGGDCGGNPVAGEAPVSSTGKTRGVILGGAPGVLIDGPMNCDDRRHAIGPYRDGLEGQLGQPHAWFNPDGGGSGSFTPVRGYSEGGYACRDFREVYNNGAGVSRNSGTACLQDDGNWHIL